MVGSDKIQHSRIHRACQEKRSQPHQDGGPEKEGRINASQAPSVACEWQGGGLVSGQASAKLDIAGHL